MQMLTSEGELCQGSAAHILGLSALPSAGAVQLPFLKTFNACTRGKVQLPFL